MMKQERFSSNEKNRIADGVDGIRRALLSNIVPFEQYPEPLLLAGDCYPGIWLEHNQDNLFLTEYAPETAWASQDAFMKFQRSDSLLPVLLPVQFHHGYFSSEAVYSQVQSVYPFARCALEIAKKTNRPQEDFQKIYRAAGRFDNWLVQYRGRDRTGLVEMYCEYDTGHDNDPRVTDGGIPHECPGGDSINMPDLPIMPILSVDLSAMLYGARIALAELADRLGLPAEAEQWRIRAEKLKSGIFQYLYDSGDDYFYDRDHTGAFRKYRSEHITRLFLNGVLDKPDFQRIYHRYFENPDEFMTPFPYPSMSVSDPAFDRNCPKNSWGSNTQALTSLRALLWLRDYGMEEERTALLSRWMRAFLDYDTQYPQELNPFNGAPVGDGKNYSPSLLLYLEGAKVLI